MFSGLLLLLSFGFASVLLVVAALLERSALLDGVAGWASLSSSGGAGLGSPGAGQADSRLGMLSLVWQLSSDMCCMLFRLLLCGVGNSGSVSGRLFVLSLLVILPQSSFCKKKNVNQFQ